MEIQNKMTITKISGNAKFNNWDLLINYDVTDQKTIGTFNIYATQPMVEQIQKTMVFNIQDQATNINFHNTAWDLDLLSEIQTLLGTIQTELAAS